MQVSGFCSEQQDPPSCIDGMQSCCEEYVHSTSAIARRRVRLSPTQHSIVLGTPRIGCHYVAMAFAVLRHQAVLSHGPRTLGRGQRGHDCMSGLQVLAILPPAVGDKGLIALPCILGHFSQIVMDSFIASNWKSSASEQRWLDGGKAEDSGV